MEKPSLPKGTRDFGPAQMAKRQFIFDNIKKVFQKYGFLPLETPAMENLSTLTGKYGEEGDQLLFRITDSGEIAKKIKDFTNKTSIERFGHITTAVLKILNEIASNFKFAQLENFLPERDLIKEYITQNQIFLNEFENQEAKENLSIIKKFFTDDEPEYFFYRNTILKIYIERKKKANDGHLFGEEILPHLPMLNQILNSIVSASAFQSLTNQQLIHLINEKGLRYDLTVPFARYVVMNRHEITFPFKRYQIQPVWRADRPQKGRYREFYQCDADVVGTDSLICEVEIILMIKEVFHALGIANYTIKINHRGVLSGLAELAGSIEKQTSLFVAIDKLDKIGEEKVKEELIARGFTAESIQKVFDILNFKGSNEDKLNLISAKNSSSDSSNKGIRDLKEVFSLLQAYGENLDHVEFDIALARGLSYYTGCIFEVKINNVSIGSVSGGGRYDNLTGVFDSKDKNSGVGISFGVDRIYDAMEELKLFPAETQVSSKVLICHFDEECKRYGLGVLNSLRQKGIASEIYPDGVKIQKQLDFANKKMIPFTIIIGTDEMKSGLLAFKDMKKGEQQKLSISDVVNTLS